MFPNFPNVSRTFQELFKRFDRFPRRFQTFSEVCKTLLNGSKGFRDVCKRFPKFLRSFQTFPKVPNRGLLAPTNFFPTALAGFFLGSCLLEFAPTPSGAGLCPPVTEAQRERGRVAFNGHPNETPCPHALSNDVPVQPTVPRFVPLT